MLQIFRNNKIIFILSTMFLLLLILSINNYLNQQNKIQILNSKIKILNNELLQEKNNIPDETIISNTIKDLNNKINLSNKTIEETEKLLKHYNVSKKCWINQMNRLIEWLEYNLNYCNDTNNLNNFQGLE